MARKLAINLNQRSIAKPKQRSFGFREQQKEKLKAVKVIDKDNLKDVKNEITRTNGANKDEELILKDKKDMTIIIPTKEYLEDNLRHEVTKIVQFHDRGRKRSRGDESTVNENDDLEEDEMMKLMGFSNFKTTKNKKVEGTDCYGTQIVQKTEYRQYMNREKGFNRPLSPTRIDQKKKRAKSAKQ